jgi:hypothetical protein
MGIIGFTAFFIWMIILILLSFLVDYLLASIFRHGGHKFFVRLGVIVHELSHATACLLTFTKIKEIKLFEDTGGHVTHEKRNSLIMSIIGMAPLFGCSLFLLFLVWLFGYVGVEFFTSGLILGNTDSFADSFIGLFEVTGKIFWENVVVNFGVITIFFLIFLYMIGSVAATIAPSGTDLKNAILGLVILACFGYLAVIFHPLSYIPGIEADTPVLDFIVEKLMIAIGIGLIGVFVILAVLVPVAILKK